MVRFWWNGGKAANGIHWTKKEQLLMEKTHGGMGFRYMDCLNDALLMKQLWQILCMSNIPLSMIMKQVYFRDSDVLAVKPKQGDSYAWRSISGMLKIFKSGLALVDGSWVWKLSSTGVYTVKSGYSLGYKWKMAREGGMGKLRTGREGS